MRRTTADPAKLKELARFYIEIAKMGLQNTGRLAPVLVLFDAMDDSPNEVISIEGRIMDSPDAKERLSAHVRAHIEKHGFTGSLMMTDTFRLAVHKGKEEALLLLRQLTNIDNPTAAKLGYGELSEVISVVVQTIDGSGFILNVPYKRGELNQGPAIEFLPEQEYPGQLSPGSRFRFFGGSDEPSEPTN